MNGLSSACGSPTNCNSNTESYRSMQWQRSSLRWWFNLRWGNMPVPCRNRTQGEILCLRTTSCVPTLWSMRSRSKMQWSVYLRWILLSVQARCGSCEQYMRPKADCRPCAARRCSTNSSGSSTETTSSCRPEKGSGSK